MAIAQRRIKNDSIDDPFEAAHDADVLVLDDLGADTSDSKWALGLFAELIDGRYRRGQPTIITTNLEINTVEAVYGSRIADRIYEVFQILHCDGPSRRRQQGV